MFKTKRPCTSAVDTSVKKTLFRSNHLRVQLVVELKHSSNHKTVPMIPRNQWENWKILESTKRLRDGSKNIYEKLTRIAESEKSEKTYRKHKHIDQSTWTPTKDTNPRNVKNTFTKSYTVQLNFERSFSPWAQVRNFHNEKSCKYLDKWVKFLVK